MHLGQGSTGERFRIISSRKGGRVFCPTGTTQESGGVLGTGQKYVWCFRAPFFAPPAVTTTTISPQIITKVPTAVSTQVSPQISPAMAQQQASPGATAAGTPVQSMPGGVSARPSAGISEQQLRDILSAQQTAADARRGFEEDKRRTELETLRRQMAQRERATQEIAQARRADDMRRVEQERYAAEQAQASAIESQALIPPPPSMAYAPSGGGALPAMPPAPALPSPDFSVTEFRAGDVLAEPAGEKPPWALILLAVAGVGVVALMGKKGGKAKRSK